MDDDDDNDMMEVGQTIAVTMATVTFKLSYTSSRASMYRFISYATLSGHSQTFKRETGSRPLLTFFPAAL
jgi:hypothetical protein